MGSYLYRLEPIFARIPTVEGPSRHVHFREKLKWTAGVLLLYFALTNVQLFGLSTGGSSDIFGFFRAIIGGAQGSLMQLGIMPIVTAGIVLQLLVGADIIDLDLSDPYDRSIYQGTQKLLVYAVVVIEAVPLVLAGYLRPDAATAQAIGVNLPVLEMIIMLQVAVGGVLVMYMDEIVSKWGIGSGVGLIIVAGVSQGIIQGLFFWEVNPQTGVPVGLAPALFEATQRFGATELLAPEGLRFLFINAGIFALIATALIFAVVVYAESTRVEVPLTHGDVRGARGRYPIKLIYASVLPLIFVRALSANLRMLGQVFWTSSIPVLGHNPWIGAFSENGTPIGGLAFYLSPLNGPQHWFPGMWREFYLSLGADIAVWQVALHFLVYALYFVVGSIIFAIFWIETSGMDANTVAQRIQRGGMHIPGFRRSPKIIQKVLARYIPRVTVVGAVILAVIALVGDAFGTLGNAGGTGLLLTVGILYRLYEQVAEEQMMEMYPMMRKMFGE